MARSTHIVRRVVRIQQDGDVPLPARVRQRYHFEIGDVVALEDTDRGVLITPAPPGATLTADEEALFAKPDPRKIARRQALAAEILANRSERDIRPLTAADLVHMAREDST